LAVACDGAVAPGDPTADGGGRDAGRAQRDGSSPFDAGADPSDAGATIGRDAAPPPEGWCRETDTVLGATVASIGAGGWAELPANDSLAALDLHYHLTTWRDTAVWNPIRRSVQWVGSPGSCCETPARYRLLVYDAATDTWTDNDTPWVGSSGHAYDGNALDPRDGIHYFARGEDVRAFDGSGWTELPELPFAGVIAPGATYFGAARDGAGGLVYVGAARRVALYDGAEWTDISIEDDTWGNYHNFAEYNPIDRVVWLGAGNDGDDRAARLDPDLAYTVLEPAPLSLNSSGRSLKTYDPLSGSYIVRNNDDDRWWEYDVLADSWVEITDAIRGGRPATFDPEHNIFGTAIDDCGVIFYFTHDYDERRAFVYRHSR
jgi:hypothetical protein